MKSLQKSLVALAVAASLSQPALAENNSDNTVNTVAAPAALSYVSYHAPYYTANAYSTVPTYYYNNYVPVAYDAGYNNQYVYVAPQATPYYYGYVPSYYYY